MIQKKFKLILGTICFLILLCILSCDNSEEKDTDLVKYTISLGEPTTKTLAGVNKINDYNYNDNHIKVDLVDNNSLNISPKIAGKTQIEVYYDNDNTKRIDVITPTDIFVIEQFTLEVEVGDYNVSETIKEELESNAFTSYSEFIFEGDSKFIFAEVDEKGREETMRGSYQFDGSKIEIDTPLKKYTYEYVIEYKNITKNNVFKEDLTDYYKGIYPAIEIESVSRIYKVIKRILPG